MTPWNELAASDRNLLKKIIVTDLLIGFFFGVQYALLIVASIFCCSMAKLVFGLSPLSYFALAIPVAVYLYSNFISHMRTRRLALVAKVQTALDTIKNR
jgi:hypothetical protein